MEGFEINLIVIGEVEGQGWLLQFCFEPLSNPSAVLFAETRTSFLSFFLSLFVFFFLTFSGGIQGRHQCLPLTDVVTNSIKEKKSFVLVHIAHYRLRAIEILHFLLQMKMLELIFFDCI